MKCANTTGRERGREGGRGRELQFSSTTFNRPKRPVITYPSTFPPPLSSLLLTLGNAVDRPAPPPSGPPESLGTLYHPARYPASFETQPRPQPSPSHGPPPSLLPSLPPLLPRRGNHHVRTRPGLGAKRCIASDPCRRQARRRLGRKGGWRKGVNGGLHLRK